jgi:arylsulfatase A
VNRRQFLSATTGALCASQSIRADASRPNIVLIYADDLGYGDLGCYGSRLRTPNIDRLAAEGARFTSFCSASSVCSPARAGLLTGRYPARVGVPGVYGPDDPGGLPVHEITLAQMLRAHGYRTGHVGKWHLGSRAPHLPNNFGFHFFYGLPYSHDMHPRSLMLNGEVIDQQAAAGQMTQRFTTEAVQFIERNVERPFFLYLPYTAPHVPLTVSPRFRKRSPFGAYGDTMEEFDWGVGEVARTIDEAGLGPNTLFLITSDNGPWYQGRSGSLKGRKGESYEGGFRVPMIARMPGRIPAGLVQNGFASALDLLPTIGSLTGAPLPPAKLDGVDITPMLTGEAVQVDRPPFLYFDYYNLQCARIGSHKLHLTRYNTRAWSPVPAAGKMNLPLPRPELYDMDDDPGEAYDLGETQTELVADLRAQVESHLIEFPAHIDWIYRETMARAVEPTDPGALPIVKN